MVSLFVSFILVNLSSADGRGVRASIKKLKKIQGSFLLLLKAFSFSFGKRLMDFSCSVIENISFQDSPNDSETE